VKEDTSSSVLLPSLQLPPPPQITVHGVTSQKTNLYEHCSQNLKILENCSIVIKLTRRALYVYRTLRCVCATIVVMGKQKVLHTPSVYLEPELLGMQSPCAILYGRLWRVRQ
jgi:hypothetical protein